MATRPCRSAHGAFVGQPPVQAVVHMETDATEARRHGEHREARPCESRVLPQPTCRCRPQRPGPQGAAAPGPVALGRNRDDRGDDPVLHDRAALDIGGARLQLNGEKAKEDGSQSQQLLRQMIGELEDVIEVLKV